MDIKECRKCGWTKPLSAFRKHKPSRDGYRRDCSVCLREYYRLYRLDNLEKAREQDRKRGNRYQEKKEYFKQYRADNQNKIKAHGLVTRARIAKTLIPEPCAVCGTEEYITAHHCDYSKPLDVMWLCAGHHQQWHVKNGAGLNG
tara:strand:- start:73 stop:504 length:432 start_codon:yes stop_codon:yes gene_type:complete